MTAEAAAFARDVISRVAPAGRERAKNLLWAAGKLADYGLELGLEPVPEVLLHPSTAERFTRCAPGLTGVARRTLRTNLRFIGRRVVPQLYPADLPLPRERSKQPYGPAQIDGYLALADAQPTAERRMRAAGLVCLGAGAGLIRGDLREVWHLPRRHHRQRQPVLPRHTAPAAGTRPARPHRHQPASRRPRPPDRGARPLQARPPHRRRPGRLPPRAVPRRHGQDPLPAPPRFDDAGPGPSRNPAAPRTSPGLLHAADDHRPPGRARQDPAETRLPVRGLAPLLYPAHRRRTRLRHRQRPRQQRHQPRLVPPHGPGPADAVHHDPADRPQPAHPRRLEHPAARKRPPRRPGPAAQNPAPPPWSPGNFVDISIMLLLVPNCQIGARNPLGLSCRADVVSGRDCNIARCSRTRRS